ncbi:MAG: glycoside hydrolase family 20 zincin-like fold domain-containing protein [Candidatus Omnitrophota bacterium]
MKKNILILAMVLIGVSAQGYAKNSINIFPDPINVQFYDYEVPLTHFWEIVILESNAELSQIIDYFNEQLFEKVNYKLPVITTNNLLKKQLIIGRNNTEALKAVGFTSEQLPNDQGYILEITKNNIFIIGENIRGIFYGIQSFLQMLNNGQAQLPGVRIVDYPKNLIRAVHFCAGDFNDIERQLDFLSTLKINTVILDSWVFFNLENRENQNKIKKAKKIADKYFIEIIPEIQSFGAPGGVLTKDPYCVEAEYVREQRFYFFNNEALPLVRGKKALTNVVKTESAPVIIKSIEGIVYQEGIDYKVILGKIKPKFKENNQTQIIRLAGGKINPGQEVRISYDQILWLDSFAEWKIPYCPSEPRTYEIMFSALENIYKIIKPRFISIGHDEIRGMNKDSRCLRRNMSNAELLADEINQLNNYAKNLDPNLRLLMWDDMINPWHNGSNENYQLGFHGPQGATQDAVKLISKDVLMMIWWTEAKDWLHKMENSLDYFKKQGFNFFAFCYDNEENIKKWVQLINNRSDCLGIICASWWGFDKSKEWFKKTAYWSWRGVF